MSGRNRIKLSVTIKILCQELNKTIPECVKFIKNREKLHVNFNGNDSSANGALNFGNKFKQSKV